MKTRLLFAEPRLTADCRLKINRALLRYAPAKGRAQWNVKVDSLCACITHMLEQVPREWPWPQAPIWGEARPVAERLHRSLSEIEKEPSLLLALDSAYFLAYPTRGTDPRGHDAHLLAADGRQVQFGELLWRMKRGVNALMQDTAGRKGARTYDAGLLWVVTEIIAHMESIFPKVPHGQGDKGLLPTIVEAVLTCQIQLTDTGTITSRTKRGPVRKPRARDLIKAAKERQRLPCFSRPPSQTVTTTTTTTPR